MNTLCILRSPKYSSATLRMAIVNSEHLFTVFNFATLSSSNFEHHKNETASYSKPTCLFKKSDNCETDRGILVKKEKLPRRMSTKLFKNNNKKIITLKIPPKDESDIFGNLSEKNSVWHPDMYEPPKEDNDLSDDSVIVKNLSKKFRCPNKYMKEMIRLVEEKKVKEALDLFVDMRRNFVTPLHSHFTFMIGVCGRIGYTEMAFKLLRQMTDRCYKPTPATLTGLFNSCGESPFPEYGLKKARLLKEKIQTKSWLVNQITYHAMIKAFGKCGDLYTAFEIVDEMAEAGFKVSVETYSFLLMSCVADKKSGFTYAVEVWRKMKAKNCLPNIFTSNLLLRATRDCDIGNEEISSVLLEHWSSYSKRPYGFLTKESLTKETVIQLSSTDGSADGTENCESKNKTNYKLQTVLKSSIVASDPKTTVTSLLSLRPINAVQSLELGNIKTPSDRLALLGGLEGFLQMLSSLKLKPDIKTFTLLLECLLPNLEEEEKLLSFIDNYQVKPDIDFFNILIKRRNFRKETEAAKNVLVLINQYELTPNIMTFGVLALGCRTLNQAIVFTSEMEKMGSVPNIEIAGCMLRNACIKLDFSYMKYVMTLMENLQIKTNEKAILNLEKTLSDIRKSIILMEQGKKVDDFYYQRENLEEDFKEFSLYYNRWLKKIRFEGEQHPWLQYKTEIIDRSTKEMESF